MTDKILFINGIIHTMESEDSTASSMLTENGYIKALDVKVCPGARVIDLMGRHVYPCMTDGHTHLLSSIVLAGNGFDLCTIENGAVCPENMQGVEKRLRAFSEGKSSGSVLVANNYIITGISEKRLPTRRELDDWCGGRPVIVYTIDGHASALSSAMLKKLGITDPEHNGWLFGEEHERRQGRLTDIIASGVTPEIIAKGCARFQNEAADFGISCVCSLEGNGDSKNDLTTKLVVFLARHFNLDVRFYFQYTDLKKAAPFARFQKQKRIGGCGDWEMDGALSAHTAAFSASYKDTGKTAPCYYTQDFVDSCVLRADAMGYQISAHAIGDLAIDRLVSALSKTSGRIRHRIDHCEFASDSALDIIAEHGWSVMAQPGYSWVDKRFMHAYEQYLPEETLKLMKFKSFVDRDIPICGSTDSPVQSLNPWLQMLGMVQYYIAEESVSNYRAFRCYTVNPARAILEENDRGKLLPGMRADFFTAECNIFALPPTELASFRPSETFYLAKPARRFKGTVTELIKTLLTPPKKI